MNMRLWRSSQNQSPLSPLKCAQIVGDIWIFCRQRFDIADFDVEFLYAGPFCAPAEKPAPLSDDACSVERITRDHKLHALTRVQIRTHDDALACSILVQHKNFNWIAQVTVIKLIVADAMQAHRRIRRDHEVKRRTRWPAIKERCWKPAGRNSLVADKCDANETACGVGLKLEQFANFCRC
jgi:hypothetical protein